LIRNGDIQKKDTYLYEGHGFGAGKGVGLHRYLFHLKHWKEGDPTWQGGKGKGIIGAINYLSEIGANTLYHIILTRNDDSDNTWPWTDREPKLIYDVSKLDQWEIVYTHMDRKGIKADLYLCEADNARHLNGGNMGTERSIFCREVVARFSHHLGLRYNVGEEHGLKTGQIKAIATHLSALDAYDHPVVSHSFHQLEKQHQQFEPLLGFQEFHGACYQLHSEHHTEVIDWREKSAKAGHKWLVAEDESWPIDEHQIDRAESYAWQVMTAGGEGMNLYIGYKDPSYNDIGLEDFSRMKKTLDYVISPAALLALPQVNQHLPQMAAADGLVGNEGKNEPPFCFAKEGSVYLVYHKRGSDIRLDLSKHSGTFEVKWWNPRKSDGGGLQDGSTQKISGGDTRSLGHPPSDPDSSWTALVLSTSLPEQASEAEAGVFIVRANAPEGTITLRYTADFASVFPNPERGWHNRRDVDGRGGNDIRDFSDVKAAGHRLVHSYLRLDDFKDSDNLSPAYLADLQAAMDAIRAQGLKIILRPSYVFSASPSVPEARILGHIGQVNAVVSTNADVVSHLESGYLGKWGEWHSGPYTELTSKSDGATRYRIIKRILDTTPDTIPLGMRYPMHLREILDELPVPDGSKPLTQVQRDRLGLHNDCFLYDTHDRGTYARMGVWFGNQTLEQQKQYAFDLITSYGGNKIMGGETCSAAIDRIDDTHNDMAKANWTEININFWQAAIDMWKQRSLPASGNDLAETEFDRISRKLGYRLRLIDATFPTSATAELSFTIAANLSNDGYASVIKPRPIYLVFDNGTARYNIQLRDVEVRKWVSGDVTLPKQTVTLPSEMPSGTYKLAMWLPDYYTNLQSRPEYSIRFANHDIWDATKGYNVLSDSVTLIR